MDEVKPQRTTRCSGIRVGIAGMDQQAHKFFLELLPNCRSMFGVIPVKDIEGEILLGTRYHDDWAVWMTLCSVATEREFYGNHPNDARDWVLDALQACAARDWHYAHEKEYEDRADILESEGIDKAPLPDMEEPF